MFNHHQHKYSIVVDLNGKPPSQREIDNVLKRLKSKFRSNLNFILVILTLAIGVAFRAISLKYDTNFELFHISIYIGLWFGLFAGFMVDGDFKRKWQVALVGIVFCSSASVFSSMLVTLFIGYLTD